MPIDSPLPVTDDPGFSDVHRVLFLLGSALERIGTPLSGPSLERCAFQLHAAMAGHARAFHTHAHILDITEGADPIEALAGLFHDVIYVQVDQGLPRSLAYLLQPLLIPDGAGFRLTDTSDPTVLRVLHIFGRAPGDTLSPFTGLNELASALVAAKLLESVLAPDDLAALCACIEATIPFRPAPSFDALAERLSALGLADVPSMVRRAVRLANRDIEGFAYTDPARFLHNTWKLLPETNPALHTPTVYSVGEYRVALQKMEGFLRTLAPERVFHTWGGEPFVGEHRRRLEQTRRNLDLAVRYLGAKLYTISLVEALARVTGGDGPIDYFMGGLPRPNAPPPLRAERFLMPPDAEAPDIDPVLLRLLEEGRAGSSSFDIPASPVSAWLYRACGEQKIQSALVQTRLWLSGALSDDAYLQSQAGPILHNIAWALGQVALTRREALAEIR